MSDQEDDRLTGGMRFSTMDFDDLTETLEAATYPQTPISGLGVADLSFVINAPLNYRLPAKPAPATLFFDHADCVRELPEDCYQVKCAYELEADAFADWARQAIGLLVHTLKKKGMVGTHLINLLEILRNSKTRQLHLAIIPYQNRNELPLEKLRAFRFRTYYGSLFAGPDMTLEMYSEVGNALDEINPFPRCTWTFLGANIYEYSPCIMLLGEFDSGEEDTEELDDLWEMSQGYPAFLKPFTD